MRGLCTVLVLAACAACAACNDPTFDVHVHLAEVPGANAVKSDNDLADVADEITVKVIDAVAAGASLVPAREATCEDLEFGYLDPAVVDGATRASGSGGAITGVPRLGPKLVLVEARKRNGLRVGAGCSGWGDVSGDASVSVDVLPVPSVRVFGRADTPLPSPVSLLLVAAWDESLPIPAHPVRTELYTSGPMYDERNPDGSLVERASDSPSGVFTTPTLPTPGAAAMPAGPAQTLVRVAWANDVARMPAFVPWGRVQVVTDDSLTLGPPQGPRNWVTANEIVRVGMFKQLAAALPTAAAPTIDLLYLDVASGRLGLEDFPGQGTRALSFSDGIAYTVLADGWYRLELTGLERQPWGALGNGVAGEVHTIHGCTGERGILVRRDEGVYVAYVRVGNFPNERMEPASGGLANLASTIQPNGETVISSGCVTVDTPGPGSSRREAVVLTRAPDFTLRARLVDDATQVALPSVVGVATFEAKPLTEPGTPRGLAAGVEVTIRGPRVMSYKLAELPPFGGGDAMLSFVPVDLVVTELATVPSSFDVADIDGDGAYDVVAAVPTQTGPRLQVNLGKMVNYEQLAGVTGDLDGGRLANDAMVRFVDVDGDDTLELMMLSSDGASVFCTPGGSAACGTD